MSSFREASRREYLSAVGTAEEINAGSLQRIADACEKMAASYDAVRADRDYWKGRTQAEVKANEALNRRILSLKGVITKLKGVAR